MFPINLSLTRAFSCSGWVRKAGTGSEASCAAFCCLGASFLAARSEESAQHHPLPSSPSCRRGPFSPQAPPKAEVQPAPPAPGTAAAAPWRPLVGSGRRAPGGHRSSALPRSPPRGNQGSSDLLLQSRRAALKQHGAKGGLAGTLITALPTLANQCPCKNYTRTSSTRY